MAGIKGKSGGQSHSTGAKAGRKIKGDIQEIKNSSVTGIPKRI